MARVGPLPHGDHLPQRLLVRARVAERAAELAVLENVPALRRRQRQGRLLQHAHLALQRERTWGLEGV
eukprot:2199534-Pyramimonas_sp.AAC.1